MGTSRTTGSTSKYSSRPKWKLRAITSDGNGVDAPVVVTDVAVVEASRRLDAILGGDELFLQLQEVIAGPQSAGRPR